MGISFSFRFCIQKEEMMMNKEKRKQNTLSYLLDRMSHMEKKKKKGDY